MADLNEKHDGQITWVVISPEEDEFCILAPYTR
jgi:hypothetical protein